MAEEEEEEEMRFGKTLGIVLVALAAIGFAGAPSASAMELCKVAGEECATENVYAEGTVVKAQASETKISTSLGTVTCKESNTEMETGGEAGSPLPASFTALSFSGCTLGESKCEVGASHALRGANRKDGERTGVGNDSPHWRRESVPVHRMRTQQMRIRLERTGLENRRRKSSCHNRQRSEPQQSFGVLRRRGFLDGDIQNNFA